MVRAGPRRNIGTLDPSLTLQRYLGILGPEGEPRSPLKRADGLERRPVNPCYKHGPTALRERPLKRPVFDRPPASIQRCRVKKDTTGPWPTMFAHVQIYKQPGPAASCCGSLEDLLDPRLFRALSDPTRLQILLRLMRCCGPCSVTEAACCQVDFSVVSRHLSILHDAGVLHADKRGRVVHYTTKYAAISRALRDLADAIDACCPEGCCAPAGAPDSDNRRPRSHRRRIDADQRPSPPTGAATSKPTRSRLPVAHTRRK